MEIRFHGHACFEIIGEQGRIFIDPFLTGNPLAKVGPKDFKELDAILVTHGHGDHLGDTIEIAKNTGATVVCVFELSRLLEKYDVKTHAMHIGGKYTFDFGVIGLTQALHGAVFVPPEDQESIAYGGLACGFLIKMEDKWIYHAGDTGLFGDMELIGRRHPLEVALLPIGDNFTMGPEDAVYAATLLKPKRVIPMHYDTFPLVEQDPAKFKEMLERDFPACKAEIIAPGESLNI
mgnify:CR=1 FL=1